MAPRYNYFGAVYTDVQNKFPGAQLTDFDDGNANGQTRIETELGRASREVAAALTPEVFKQITTVDCETVVKYAALGQTTGNLSLTPILASSVHLWWYPNIELWDPSRYPTLRVPMAGGFNNDWFYRKPQLGVLEIDQVAQGVVVNLATGAITGLQAMAAGDRIFASYDLDCASASYAMQSLADVVITGAAAVLGSRLFGASSAAWELVTDLQKAYDAALERIRKGLIIPDEVRRVPHFVPVERASDQVGSVRLYRGG